MVGGRGLTVVCGLVCGGAAQRACHLSNVMRPCYVSRSQVNWDVIVAREEAAGVVTDCSTSQPINQPAS